MNKKKNIIIMIIIAILIIVTGGIIFNSSTEKKHNLEISELKELEKFINNIENNAFILMNYSKPEDIMTIENAEILEYSISASNYSKNATENQNKIIWNGSEAQISTKISSLEEIQNFIKEKTDYEVPPDKIKTTFSEYLNEELNLYYYMISDTIYEEHKISDGYKIKNKYYITLDDRREVILILSGTNKFHFHSCHIK